jgi:hypothetical protein
MKVVVNGGKVEIHGGRECALPLNKPCEGLRRRTAKLMARKQEVPRDEGLWLGPSGLSGADDEEVLKHGGFADDLPGLVNPPGYAGRVRGALQRQRKKLLKAGNALLEKTIRLHLIGLDQERAILFNAEGVEPWLGVDEEFYADG